VNFADELQKFNEAKLPENFVSIAVKIDNRKATHAAILIRHINNNYLCHFPGQTSPEIIENFNEEGWYIYKIWEIINFEDENEVGAFLQYCRRVCDSSTITYSYIADGSKHNFKGEFISKSGLPELGTCVGFCVNTLSDSIIDAESYFHLDDWDDSELIAAVDKWALEQVNNKYPDLDWTLYNAFKKRITPHDFLCSSFITNEYPIRKSKIDSISTDVQNVINEKF
jgi:hypothetical protein